MTGINLAGNYLKVNYRESKYREACMALISPPCPTLARSREFPLKVSYKLFLLNYFL